MQNQITQLEIQNFKSIKQLNIGCKRINLFIGKPNVGKSNILEAISLLGAPYEQNETKYLSSFIRYENFDNLFFDQETENLIRISSNIGKAVLEYYPSDNTYVFQLTDGLSLKSNTSFDKSIPTIQSKINSITNSISSALGPNFLKIEASGAVQHLSFDQDNPVKKYDFKNFDKNENRFPKFLMPPHGNNLFTILQGGKEFYKTIAPLFKEYGLELVLKVKENKFEIQKNIEGIVITYPYSTIADTLQRIIFYLTAIEFNKDSVLLFEEPEAHAFPPYTHMLADRIVQSQNNQFFITTHSPYLLHTIIENTPFEELGVLVTYFEDYQTKVKALSQEKIRDVLDDSIDVFFNLDRLISNE